MRDIEDMAMKIFNAYEDVFYEKEKKKIFENLFDKYLTIADTVGTMEPYDAIVSLGYRHRLEFDQLVKALKDHSLI
jgi:hypothetical protein